jgi:hypothetical protein
MLPVEFEPTISAGERPQTYALDRAATGTGINSTSIPPIMIMSRMYENTKLLYIVPLIKHTTVVVCISSISPVAMGCFICVNINLVIGVSDCYNPDCRKVNQSARIRPVGR